jgi:hypothetical protein
MEILTEMEVSESLVYIFAVLSTTRYEEVKSAHSSHFNTRLYTLRPLITFSQGPTSAVTQYHMSSK